MTDQTPTVPVPPRGRGPVGAVVGLAVVLGCVGVLYGMRSTGKEGAGRCRAAAATVARLGPLVHGEVAALALERDPRPVADLAFNDPDGRPTTLAAYKGKAVLLNLWATWCGPCRKEMPALDALQAKLGGQDFTVLPINIDTDKPDRPGTFLREAGVTHLPLNADPSATVFQVLRAGGQAVGLPTTLILDRNGCQLGVMAGPADWNSSEAEALIVAAKAS